MRTRIMAAFAACIILPLAAGWASLWLSADNDARNRTFNELKATARMTMASVEERLAQNLTHMKAWRTMPMMQEVLINDDGGELAQVLGDLNRAYPDFASLTVTSARGAVVATTDKALRKADLTEAAGIKEAISGRTTQSSFTKLAANTPDAVRFTVPLVASYDRQTVIGTLTGVIRINELVGRTLRSQDQGRQQQIVILARQQDRQVLFTSQMSGAIAAAARTIDIGASRRPIAMSIAGEPGIAAIERSGTRTLGQDPGLVTIVFAPRSAITAPASSLSGTFLAVAGVAALGAMIFAWRWTTPLVKLGHAFDQTNAGSHHKASPAPSAFAPLSEAIERLKAVRNERDALAIEARDLSLAVALARKDAGQARERLQHLGDALTERMGDLTEVVELINQQNLAAAGQRHRQPQLQTLNHAMLDLLHVIHEAVEAAQDPATQERERTDASAPEVERRSA
jgi:hypothetical protein